jgi:ATP-dependent helicase/nuclease subunit A
MHKFMQFADYEAARDALDREIKRMRAQHYLTEMETESLSKARLRAFFQSTLASRIFSSPRVFRELKFMAEFGRKELSAFIDDMDEESLVAVQGVADCVFIEDGKAVIVDYKTDRVKTERELLDRYAVQLDFYRKILARSLDMPVKECVIYSFSLSCDISV